jgi:hypothetical protein
MSDDPHAGDEYDLIDVPTAVDYKRALKACRDAGALRDDITILKMLEVNYKAKDHTLTAGELADSVKLADVIVANGHYGRFAKKLCKQLGRREPESRATRAGKELIWIAILVKFSGGKAGSRRSDDESIRWTLLPELVTALEETFFSHLQPQC